MHGCSGLPTRSVTVWQPLMLSWGYATFVVDSFGGRGLRGVCANALRLTGAHRIPDAYGALALLARHPRIDAERVALMGFSHGGIATLGAASTWARRRYSPLDGPAFRAFVPFYPYCNAIVPEMSEGIAAPVRIHIGEIDDWKPARSCEELGALARVARLRLRGHRLSRRAPRLRRGRAASRDLSAQRRQRRRVHAAARVDDGADPESLRAHRCMKKGATVGHDPAATELARINVRAELTSLLR